ncbi:hypothetical protein K457DRAFT_162225 [Linnemannia elongata AG-77]|uniref:Uncharacterized protein n=1 Tax=Linnemannia elongata AG-77 TaxID=1314771 RepID=A0A197KIH7_9FUNG|nr:hypothetical protein K457DRAFT_162225 [Linnemannia elongata AG-77]
MDSCSTRVFCRIETTSLVQTKSTDKIVALAIQALEITMTRIPLKTASSATPSNNKCLHPRHHRPHCPCPLPPLPPRPRPRPHPHHHRPHLSSLLHIALLARVRAPTAGQLSPFSLSQRRVRIQISRNPRSQH